MDRRPSNRISLAALLLVAVVAGALIAAGLLSNSNNAGVTPTTPSPTGTNVEQNQSTYPKMGHAPDYSWVAGQVAFTRIQGGCTYIRAAPAATPQPGSEKPTPGG